MLTICTQNFQLPSHQPTCVTIGNFDGVHRGHQSLLREVCQAAKKEGAVAAVITFDPHPRHFFQTTHTPFLLTSPKQRLTQLAAHGIDLCLVLPFNAHIAALSPHDFVQRHLAPLSPAQLFVGKGFRFGHQRSGTTDDLMRLGQTFGFAVNCLEPLDDTQVPISSTRIRAAIQEADIALATKLLGRPYSLQGRIVRGDRRGRALGFPTANLGPVPGLVPPDGIYCTSLWRTHESRARPALTSIGHRPTFYSAKEGQVVVETFLIDTTPQLDLYGEEVEVAFHTKLRDQHFFPSEDALIAQMHRDLHQAQGWHSQHRLAND